MGLIIRTAGLNKTKNEIKKDYSILNKLWVQIVNETKKAIAPALIHEEGNLLRRIVRDSFKRYERNFSSRKRWLKKQKIHDSVLPTPSLLNL